MDTCAICGKVKKVADLCCPRKRLQDYSDSELPPKKRRKFIQERGRSSQPGRRAPSLSLLCSPSSTSQLPIYLSIYLSISLYLSIYLSLSFSLSISLSFSLLSIYLSISLLLSIYLSCACSFSINNPFPLSFTLFLFCSLSLLYSLSLSHRNK